MLQSVLQRMQEAFLEGCSAPRLEKTVHLELWEWGAGGSLKKPGKSGGASLGTDLVQYPCPQGVWKPVQCPYSFRPLVGRSWGGPLWEADSRKTLNGMCWKWLLLW